MGSSLEALVVFMCWEGADLQLNEFVIRQDHSQAAKLDNLMVTTTF